MSTPLVHEPRSAERRGSGKASAEVEQWQRLVDLLRKGIVRISHAVTGVDASLDQHLRDLRQSLRNDIDPQSLETLVDAVSKGVVALDSQQRKSNRQQQIAAKGLLEALETLQPSASVRRRKKALAASIGSDKTDLSSFLNDYSRLLQQALSESQQAKKGDVGFFARVLGKGGDQDDPAQAEIQAVVERVRQSLQVVVDSIDGEEEMTHSVQALQQRLNQGINPLELPDLLEEIAELIKTATSLQQKSFEAFVESMAEQFSELQVIANTNAASACDSQSARQQFEQELGEKTKAIKTHLSKATNLSQLQKAIAEEVDGIGEALGRYHMGEDLRHKKFEASVGLLQGKLGEAHSECNSLYSEIQHLRTQSQLDPLTGLPNRAGFMDRAQQEYERTVRYEHRLTVAIADIDHFKQINDRYGHPAGDTVITEVASLIAAKLRRADFVCRYGGEEFVILLPETPLEKAQQVADKIRMAVSDCPFAFRDRRVQVTISIGVAELESGQSISDVVEKADVALYAAKSAGRNRVMASKTH